MASQPAPGGVLGRESKASDGSSLHDDERQHYDAEKHDPKVQEMANKYGKEDPFGDESNSSVKYKTMRWW